VYRYLAVVRDKSSRRVLGWAYGKKKDVALTLEALNRAVHSRKPRRGLIFYNGLTYQKDDGICAALKSYLPFCNSARLHSSLNYVSPATSEQLAR